jgi:hypothetical protein
MDPDCIIHPLRSANGSHQSRSNDRCIMNAISHINGDTQITDFPARSAHPLAVLVRSCNDLLAGHNRYLSSGNSLLALELGWQTAGTTDVADTVMHAWLAELLANPTWGVARYTKLTAIKAISDIAALHRKTAAGNTPARSAWNAAYQATRGAGRIIDPTRDPAGLYAVRAAYQSTAPIDAYGRTTLNAITGNAIRAHALAAGGNMATRVMEITHHAIHAWRDLATRTIRDVPETAPPAQRGHAS